MKVILMGTGTSHGIPVISCGCAVCRSSDPHDKRLRCSAFIEHDGKSILVDVGPDFREQALKFGINRLDSVFLTHSHADHLHGIDDLRIFSHKNSRVMKKDAAINDKFPETAGNGLPIYTSARTAQYVRSRFPYIFVDHDKGGGVPKIQLIDTDANTPANPVLIGQVEVVPIPMMHGNHHTNGYVFGYRDEQSRKKSFAYLTDCSFISDESISMVKEAGGDIVHLVIDALREKEHSSHCNFAQALGYAERIGAQHTWFTHITHDMNHEQIQSCIDGRISSYTNLSRIIREGGTVSPAYDGLAFVI